MNERFRKAELIAKMYETRKYRQEDIARELNMPISEVREVTKAYGYEHGKLKQSSSPNNLNEDQLIPAFIDGENLSFLDKYNF